MLNSIIFCLQKKTDIDFAGKVSEACEYVRACGVKGRVICPDSEDQTKDRLLLSLLAGSDEENISDILFLTDSPTLADYLLSSGCYTVGMAGDNTSVEFPGLKYVFSEIDQVDFDSYLKAYQRYAHLPWTILETDRLIVRETTVEDVDDFYEIYADPEITEFLEDLFENPEDEKKYQADYIDKVYGLLGFGIWTVILKENGKIIGRAGYSIRNGFDDIELGFLIGLAYQGNGYAYEACRAILDYGRDVLQLHRVLAFVKEGNRVSIRLCEKLGFVKSGDVRIEENIYGETYRDGERVAKESANYGNYVKLSLEM